MRILISVEEFSPEKGYLEYYLAKELVKQGHQVLVVTFGRGPSVQRLTLSEGIVVYRIPYITTLNGNHIPSVAAPIHIARIIKTERPEIIHCQPLFSPLALLFISSRWSLKYKVVGSIISGYSPRASGTSFFRSLKYAIAKIVIENFVKRNSETIFALSEGLKKVLLKLFDISPSRISVIPLGADSVLFKFDNRARIRVRKKLHLSEEDIVVTHCGSIVQARDLHILIDAIAPIMKRDRRVKLLFVGEGNAEYVGALEKLVSKYRVSNHVIFHPQVHRMKLPAFYSATDIAVWPGGPSISIFEAASTGLPLIVRKSPFITHAVSNNNGFVIRRGDVRELRRYLELLIGDDGLRAEMGRKSRQLVERKLNWRRIVTRFLEEYKGALK